MADFDANLQWDLDYQFTITGGKVTAMQAVMGKHVHDLHLPRNATFAVDGATVSETLTGGGATHVVTFTQQAGSATLYDISDIKTTFASLNTAKAGFAFSIYDGSVSGGPSWVETSHGHTHTEAVRVPLDAVFAKDGATITEQFVRGNEVDTIVYVQPSGSNLYAIASTEHAFVAPGAATTILDVDPQDRMAFTLDGAGAVSQAQRLDGQGGLHTVAANPHVTFTQLAPGYVEQVTTYGQHSSYVVYFAGSSDNGTYTEVAHGAGSTVDLAGLQAQVAQAETHLPTTGYSATGWVI